MIADADLDPAQGDLYTTSAAGTELFSTHGAGTELYSTHGTGTELHSNDTGTTTTRPKRK
jgi:hypothetical protein